MSIRVKAIKKGHYGILRVPGEKHEIFDIKDENGLGSWMERLDGKPNPKADMVKEFPDEAFQEPPSDQYKKHALSQQQQVKTTATQQVMDQREAEGDTSAESVSIEDAGSGSEPGDSTGTGDVDFLN